MFTGIVTDQGEIMAMRQEGDLRARIATSYDVNRLDIGASVSCDGVCLTVIAKGHEPGPWFEVQASAETLGKTNLSLWGPGKRINLERALKVGDELGGHIVTGHVDGIGEVASVRPEGDSLRIEIVAGAEVKAAHVVGGRDAGAQIALLPESQDLSLVGDDAGEHGWVLPFWA